MRTWEGPNPESAGARATAGCLGLVAGVLVLWAIAALLGIAVIEEVTR